MSSGEKVSVLIPVRNERAFIEESLGSILAQDFPQNRLEILIIDGMSEDGTREIVKSYQGKHPNIVLLDNPKGTVAPGLNIGIKSARGDILIRIDGHLRLNTDYVSNCVSLLIKGEADTVGGIVEAQGQSKVSNAIAAALGSQLGSGGAAFRSKDAVKHYADTVPFFACFKELFRKVGGFDEELVRNQDDEFNYRLRKLGFRILLDPKIRLGYYCRNSIRALWRQYFQYGFWKVRVLQKHPKQMQIRQFIPPGFVAMLLVVGLLGLISTVAKVLFLGLCVFYFSIVIGASAKVFLKGDKSSGLYLPVIYPIIHFSYGVGFCCGLVRFWNRWGKQ